MSYLIGVDLGTSGTKAALYQTDGVRLTKASANVPLHTVRPGVVEQEQADFYTTAAETVRACLRAAGIDARDVAAIAFNSQMAGVGAIDDAWQPVGPFDSWLDMRCQPYIEQLARDHGERITRLTGCPPTCDHGPKIMWRRDARPAEYDRIARFLMPSAYVAGRMAGLAADDAFIDHTFLHFTALADTERGVWSEELCTLLDVTPEKLPRIVAPWDVIGMVTPQAAADFGLAEGTPIAAGCGDTAAGALGAGIVRPGMLFDVAGTASVLAASTDHFVADVAHGALLTMRAVVPGLYNPLAYIGGGGQALRWFRDEFFNSWRGTRQPSDGDLYEAMIALAAQAPAGADGLLFSPHLGGRICPATPAMRGVWHGFSWSHTQAHFARAILESVAYEYAYYLTILRESLPDLTLHEARAIGGGAASTTWNQIKADVLDVPYQRLDRAEFGTWGSAMIAGKAAGLFDDLAAVAEQHARPAGAPLQPNAQRHQLYQPIVAEYIAWQATLQDVFMRRSNANE